VKNLYVVCQADYTSNSCGINLDTSGVYSYNLIMQIEDSEALGCKAGLYFKGNDAKFDSLGLHGDPYSLWVDGGCANVFSTLRCDGGIFVHWISDCSFGPLVVDVYTYDVSGFTFYGAQGCTLSNAVFSIAGGSAAANNYAAVNLTKSGTAWPYDYVVDNAISNVYAGRRDDFSAAHKFKYGVYEAESSAYIDYNLFANINANDTTTGNLKQGAHSNMTNYLPYP
jgi:hypothetical protein